MTMKWVLCDIGGTHIRFALSGEEGPSRLQKYNISDFSDLKSALSHYCEDPPQGLALSSTSWLEDGTIRYRRFFDNVPLDIRIDDLKNDLKLEDILFLNDLESACHALKDLDQNSFWILKHGNPVTTNNHKCVLNIGTGCGHAYLFEDGNVLKTYGGHVPLGVTSDEQMRVRKWIEKNRTQNRDLIIEDVLSIRGLQWIYASLSNDAEDKPFPELLKILQNKSEATQKTLDLFAQFLGQHAQNLTHLPFVYGGLYLTGGVIDSLIENDLFEKETFERFFVGNAVSVVENSLKAMPVYYCTEKNLPLYGLNHIIRTK